MKFHEPVLLSEVLENLNVEKGKKYIDATLGDGGHTLAMLAQGAYVLGLDYDPESLERASNRIKAAGLEQNFLPVRGNFRDIVELAQKHNFTQVDGILFDLGYSSYQLDSAEQGLSFLRDEPLDMRLDKSLGVTAADIVNTLSEKQLDWLFREYGEEGVARRFAKGIIERRKLKKFTTTGELVDLLVEKAPPGYDRGRKHPATRVFQALRIVVNDELENLKSSLPRAAQLLKLPGGRMAIISFHSLEDRVAKNLGQTVRPENIFLQPVNTKPITASTKEVRKNKRARSAKLRVYERMQ